MVEGMKTNFHELLERRRCYDAAAMEEAMRQLARAVAGASEAECAVAGQFDTALQEAAAYYGSKGNEIPGKREWIRREQLLSEEHPPLGSDEALSWVDQRISAALVGTGAQYRLAELSGNWYEDAAGVLIAFLDDCTPVTLVPVAHGYSFKDPETGRRRRVHKDDAARFARCAFCFYRPLPSRPLSLRDIIVYLLQGFELRDVLLVLGCLVLSTALGMLLPLANAMLFGPVLSAGNMAILPNAAVMLVSIGIAQAVINAAKNLALAGVGNKLALHVQAAAMMRMLSLPASFFRNRSAGELSSLLEGFPAVARNIQQVVLGAALSSVFSLVYLVQVFAMTPALGLPASAVVVANVTVTVIVSLAQAKVNRRRIALRADLDGWQSALLGSMRTVRANGAEKRAFATWAPRYARVARLEYNGPLLARVANTLQLGVSLFGTVAIYGAAVTAGVSSAEYMAFSSAFGMVLGSFMALASATGTAAQIRPQLDVLAPILNANPEVAADRPAVDNISGRIDLDHVTFGYSSGKPVVRDLTLHVEPGDYVAIVGASGCGKSTIMRLMLGFETPQHGAVCFDGHDLRDIDCQILRRNIGVVLQDTQLFQGDILSNITISAPWLGEEDAWKAAEGAGIADDIRTLPMGMSTVVAAGGIGFSGGQKQRLAIARALVSQPTILMFDEATSALDNKTQQVVSDTLDSLDCTRIIIAHRISTIRNCKRICMLEEGRIVEEGTYDELIKRRGAFFDLVSQQKL